MELDAGIATSLRKSLDDEIRCPVNAVNIVLEAVRFYIGDARVYQYLEDRPLKTIVVVVPRGSRRSWITYAIAKHGELKGVDIYSFINLVVLKDDEFDRLFPYGKGKLKELKDPSDLVCS